MQRNHPSHVACRRLNVIICAMSIFWLLQVQAEGQFFTKTTSSIPRMGRRASQDTPPSLDKNVRHLFIDRLVDEFGPNLLEAYKAARLSSDEPRGYGQQNDWLLEAYNSLRRDNPNDVRYM